MPARRVAFLLPSDSERCTGGHVFDTRVVRGLRARGWTFDEHSLPPGFPHPDATARAEAARTLAGFPDGALLLADAYATSTLPEVLEAHGRRLRLVCFVHHPYAAEPGLPPAEWRRLVAAERLALPHLTRAIVTSRLTATTVERDYGLPASRISLAYPGTDLAPVAGGSRSAVLVLLAVGTVMPRKDQLGLVEALGRLRKLPWRLRIAGNTERFPETVAAVRARAAALGIADRVELTGELPMGALAAAWRGADMVVSASRHEGFGMALAEGIARGLPAVAVAGGAIPEWLSPEAALLVRPGDPAALTVALRTAILDQELRERLRAGALRLRGRLPTWLDATLAVEQALLAAATPSAVDDQSPAMAIRVSPRQPTCMARAAGTASP
jgi:glycosyltransferase involved in cell wall biosynthesis